MYRLSRQGMNGELTYTLGLLPHLCRRPTIAVAGPLNPTDPHHPDANPPGTDSRKGR